MKYSHEHRCFRKVSEATARLFDEKVERWCVNSTERRLVVTLWDIAGLSATRQRGRRTVSGRWIECVVEKRASQQAASQRPLCAMTCTLRWHRHLFGRHREPKEGSLCSSPWRTRGPGHSRWITDNREHVSFLIGNSPYYLAEFAMPNAQSTLLNTFFSRNPLLLCVR